mmetsp:Transcript_98141/g.120192  ORF Transcript_98141/g.120192 Transcript_98141/m.120192 type:complete len:434 (+) Transcript_98141:59-1360(+)
MSVNSVSTNFNDLQKTQNSLLNDLANMKSRVNKLLSRKMDVNTFIEMENKQYGLQLKLLNILNDIKMISQSNNVSSNDKNIVNDILIHFFKDLEERQQQVFKKIDLIKGELNKSNDNEFKKIIDRLDIDKLESSKITGKSSGNASNNGNTNGVNNENNSQQNNGNDDIKGNSDDNDGNSDSNDNNEDRNDEHDFFSRKKELSKACDKLFKICQDMDMSSSGYIDDGSLTVALKDLGLYGVNSDKIYNLDHVNKVYSELESKNDTGLHDGISYQLLCDMIIDPNYTLKSKYYKDWNELRLNLVGKKIKNGLVNVYFKFDAWPKSSLITVRYNNTKRGLKCKPKIFMNAIAKLNDQYDNAFDDLKEIKCKTTASDLIGKPEGWRNVVNRNDNIMLVKNGEGTLEIEFWFRTNDFMNKKGGIPYHMQRLQSFGAVM